MKQIVTITQFEPIELRQYFDSDCMNKPVTFLHPFEEFVPCVGRQLTQDGYELLAMLNRNMGTNGSN